MFVLRGCGVAMQGRSIISRLAGALLIFVLSLGLQLITAAPAAAASLTLSPSSGVAGTSVQVIGTGFPASFPVALCWDGSGCSDLGTFQSGSGSTFSASVTIPPDALAGGHQIMACRQGSQTCATALFSVLPSATTTSTTTTVTTPSTTVPGTGSTVVTSTTLVTSTTSTATGVPPSTTPATTVTTDAPVTTTTTIPAFGPIGDTTTTSPSASFTGDAPPPKATSSSGGDLGPGSMAGQGGGDLVLAASSRAEDEGFPWLSSRPSGIDNESPRGIPTIPRPGSVEAPDIPSWLRPVSALANLPLWGLAAVLSAGVAALFFVIPLIGRWLWNLSEDE